MTGSASENVALRQRVSELEGKLATVSALEEKFAQVSALDEDKAAKLSALEERFAQLAARVDGAQLVVPGDALATGGPPDGSELDGGVEVRGSRRHLLKMAGATVIGAVAATLLDASPAAATTGTMVYGTSMNAGADYTELNSTSGSQTFAAYNTGIGIGLYATDGATGTGIPISGVVSNGVNASAAVEANNGGTGPGVASYSTHSYGVQAQGALAPLWLVPAGTAGAPTSGAHRTGELFVDLNGVFYKCLTYGVPGVWVPLHSVVPLPAPVRVLDTTNGTGGITGPLVPGATVHTTSTLTGANGIPAGAVGLVGNLAVSGVNGALLNGYGVMTLYPAGGSTPGTANINSGAGCFAISNSVTVALGTGANAGQLSLVWDGGGPVPNAQAFLDIAGYLL